MRLIILFLCCILFFWCSPKTSGPEDKGPTLPLFLPAKVSWINTSVDTDEKGRSSIRREAFAANGEKWRLEIEKKNKSPVVFVFDGVNLSSSKKIKSSDPEYKNPNFWDPRTGIKKGYDALAGFKYKGIKHIRKYDCWYFSIEEEGNEIHFWIDIKKIIPRRLTVKYPDGHSEMHNYYNMPGNVLISPGLFETKNLKTMILNKLEPL
jgi:hypothetical protein